MKIYKEGNCQDCGTDQNVVECNGQTIVSPLYRCPYTLKIDEADNADGWFEPQDNRLRCIECYYKYEDIERWRTWKDKENEKFTNEYAKQLNCNLDELPEKDNYCYDCGISNELEKSQSLNEDLYLCNGETEVPRLTEFKNAPPGHRIGIDEFNEIPDYIGQDNRLRCHDCYITYMEEEQEEFWANIQPRLYSKLLEDREDLKIADKNEQLRFFD